MMIGEIAMKTIRIIALAASALLCAASLSACSGIADPARPVTLVSETKTDQKGTFSFRTFNGSLSGASESNYISWTAEDFTRDDMDTRVSVKRFVENYDGMRVFQNYADSLGGNCYTTDIYIGRDDQLIFEYTLSDEYDEDMIDSIGSYISDVLDKVSGSISDDIDRISDTYNIEPFGLFLRFRDLGGSVIFQSEVS